MVPGLGVLAKSDQECNSASSVASVGRARSRVGFGHDRWLLPLFLFARTDHDQTNAQAIQISRTISEQYARRPHGPRMLFGYCREDATQTGPTLRGLRDARYDDGPIDVAGQFNFLHDGSPFRKELPEMPANELGDALCDWTGTRTVNSVLSQLLINLPEFKSRPKLVTALVPLIERPNDLALDVIVNLVRALELSDNRDLAVSTFAEALERTILIGRYHWVPDEAWTFLSRARPSQTLRLLRRTRPDGVRTHADEDSRRAIAAARSLFQLKRPKQAIRLLETILEKGDVSGKAQTRSLLKKIQQ